MLPVCGRHHRFEAHGAVAAHYGGRRGGRVRRDNQSLGRRERVAAVGKRRRRRRRRGRRVAGQRRRAGCRDHRVVTVSCVLGLRVPVSAVGGGGEGLTRVSVVAGVGVGVVVGFGVVPVAAVVRVGGRERVVL